MSTISIFESTFAQSDKTDAILVVEDKKLHVNKALLSYHSDYFNTLFNGEFKEKSMQEIPIKDVKYEDFATLLRDEDKLEALLELADRFLIPAAKRHVELFIGQTYMDTPKKLKLADKYDLEVLLEQTLDPYHRKESTMSFYESTFSQSDKTDAILIVEDKKLHVNKALLSYHSDYFNTLFNGEFKEKSMPEIPIEDVKYKKFATLLSLVQDKPIKLKWNWETLESLLELSDRFLMPAAKRHVELFIAQMGLNKLEELETADKYDLEVLLQHALELYEDLYDFRGCFNDFEKFSDKTKLAIFNYFFRCFDNAF